MDKNCEEMDHQGEQFEEIMDNKKNPLLMEYNLAHVLQYLDEKDLKSSTLVSKLWCQEGSREFIKTGYIQLPPKFHDNFQLKPDEERNVILKNSAEFLSSRFHLISNLIINDDRDVEIFLKLGILDSKIKRIKVMAVNYTSVKFVEKILTACPNLVYMDTKKMVEGNGERNSRESAFGISLMEQICAQVEKNPYRASQFTVTDLMVNLMGVLISGRLAQYQNFATLGNRVNNLILINPGEIQHLQLENRAQLLEATNKMLFTRQEIMTKLEFSPTSYVVRDNGTIFNELIIPVMPNLHTFNIHLQSARLSNLFHPNFKFAQNFPNLKTVNLKQSADNFHRGINYLEETFASTGPASSVKNLSFGPVSGSYTNLTIRSLFEIFNGLEEFSLEYFPFGRQDFSLNELFLVCGKLKKLEIRDANSGLMTQLTGLEEEDVEQILWELTEKQIKEMKLEKPTNPSIVNLQDLEQLTITTVEGTDAKIGWLLHKISSDFMPNLKSIKIEPSES